MPGAEEHASVSAIFRVWIDDCTIRILPGNIRPSVNAPNLEEALIFALWPIVQCLHSENEHVEDIRVFLLQNAYWSSLDHFIWNSDNWSVTRIIRWCTVTVSTVATSGRVDNGRIWVCGIRISWIRVGRVWVGRVWVSMIGTGMI